METEDVRSTEETLMNKTEQNQDTLTIAQQIAKAVKEYQMRITGHAPKSVTVILSDDTLVINLHEALSIAERTLANTPEGAAQVQEFHRQLFATSFKVLKQTIMRITGRAVRKAAAEIDSDTGAIVQAFTTGTVVQFFQMEGLESPEKSDETDDESSRSLRKG